MWWRSTANKYGVLTDTGRCVGYVREDHSVTIDCPGRPLSHRWLSNSVIYPFYTKKRYICSNSSMGFSSVFYLLWTKNRGAGFKSNLRRLSVFFWNTFSEFISTQQPRKNNLRVGRYGINIILKWSTETYMYNHWEPQLSDFVPLNNDYLVTFWWDLIKLVARAIEVSNGACKDKLGRSPRSHSWSFFILKYYAGDSGIHMI